MMMKEPAPHSMSTLSETQELWFFTKDGLINPVVVKVTSTDGKS